MSAIHRSRLPVVVAVALVLATTGCKTKLEATVTGPAPGSTDKVRVHVVGTGGSDLTCSDGACEATKLPYSGETDITVSVPASDAKVVTITTKKGLRRGSTTIDLAAGGAGSTLTVKNGNIACVPTGCSGSIEIAPKSRITFQAPAGTTIDIGGEKLTVPAGGSLVSPLKLALSPPLEKQPLEKVCTGGSTPSAVLASTTLTVTLPGKAALSAKADFDAVLAERGLAMALDDVAKGALVFPWEKSGEAAKGKRAAVFVHGGSCYDAGASGATVADLDVIAIADNQEREEDCDYHLTSSGSASGKITLHDKKATAYDRVTGKSLGTKVFLAPKDCTKEITVKEGTTNVASQSAYVSSDLIAKWAATFAR